MVVTGIELHGQFRINMINVFILIAGLLVYAGYGFAGLAFLLGAVLISYVLGLFILKKAWIMWFGSAVFAAYLLLIKLEPLTGMQLLAPMGLSYFCLQIISYLVDVHRGKYPPERNFLRYALFVTYLPHLFIGPIERYDAMMVSLHQRRSWTWNGFSKGLIRILWGLFKKFVIAARAGIVVSTISGDTASYSGAYALGAMLLYSIQIYADFSGGIDMVLGISRILGIRLTENFDAPYFSQSFKEFWRRWHITLGSWLREYVYIPLGGNRKGRMRQIINLIVTFLVSGIWHGVQYLVWGLLNGIFVACGTKFQTRWKTLNRAVTFLLISFLWSFFIWPDMWSAISMIGSVFTTFNYSALVSGIGMLGLTSGDWIVLFIATLALWLYDWKGQRIRQRLSNCGPALKTTVISILILVVLVFGIYGIGFNAESFIYSRF